MALLCEAGAKTCVPPPERRRGETRTGADDLVEREDSRLPLLETDSPLRAPGTGAFGAEHERAVGEAMSLLSAQLKELKSGKKVLNRTETSELLRDICQELADLTTPMEGAWRRNHPGQPLPKWPASSIPEEELAKIGWDFNANRVQMLRNTGGSILESIAFLFRGDESASFAKPPSAGAVAEALSRIEARLGGCEVPADGSTERQTSPRSTSRLGGR
mmetsp:Transcript_67372/g.170965  ORF Transcript_67372/g.170965 Transcript_67372/m.170965 type:complete len:218 (-) Transcript_67372:361-1014(-)